MDRKNFAIRSLGLLFIISIILIALYIAINNKNLKSQIYYNVNTQGTINGMKCGKSKSCSWCHPPA